MKEAIAILKSEHRSISALPARAEGARAHGARCDRAAALPGAAQHAAYIDEYPEKLHHPKEDEHLFARWSAARRPERAAGGGPEGRASRRASA
jgi:hypothetical protein